MLCKAVNYFSVVGVKVRKKEGKGAERRLPRYFPYGVRLRVEDLRPLKGAALPVNYSPGAVRYEILAGKFAARLLVLKPIRIYNEVVLYYTKLLVV